MAIRMLLTGGGFATAISTILGVVGLYGLGNTATIEALITSCVIAALTMFTTARMLRDPNPQREPTARPDRR